MLLSILVRKKKRLIITLYSDPFLKIGLIHRKVARHFVVFYYIVNMKITTLLTGILCLFSVLIFGQTTITGKIIDSETKEPLSYSSLAVLNSSTGTMTNAYGEFELTLKENQIEVEVSYIGYTEKIVQIEEGKTEYLVELDPFAFELTEIIVKSLTPLEYIKKALEKHPSLIPDKPFAARSFFASKSTVKNDDSNTYSLDQAVFKTYYNDYANDTLKEPSQLLLHQFKEEGGFTSILEKNRRLNKMSRKNKKNKNEAPIDSLENEEVNVDINIDDITGAGPSSALKKSKSITKLEFFNSEYFKKFTYTFGDQTHYQGRELIRIDFFNKRKVEGQKFKGSVYLDHEDLAIVAIDYNTSGNVPFYINALLKTVVGFTISGLESDVSIRNQYLDKWYPKELVFDLDISLKQKGEIETTTLAQVLSIEEIIYEDPSPIAEEKVFDEEKEYTEQIHPIDGIIWSDVNIVKLD